MRTRFLGLFVIGFTSLLLSGCFGSGTAPVSGTIKFEDGTPLTKGDLEFKKEGEELSALGSIGDGGQFTAYTYTEGDGVPPGKYTVTIMNSEPPVNSIYGDASTSTLKIDVPAGGKTFDLKVTK